jgi:hypothetical protein
LLASQIRGDTNADGNFDISDVIVTLACLFLGAACPACPDVMDANDDGLTNIADSIYLLSWRFIEGPPPPAPFPACGKDPEADVLDDCESFSPCQ